MNAFCIQMFLQLISIPGCDRKSRYDHFLKHKIVQQHASYVGIQILMEYVGSVLLLLVLKYRQESKNCEQTFNYLSYFKILSNHNSGYRTDTSQLANAFISTTDYSSLAASYLFLFGGIKTLLKTLDHSEEVQIC